jgi:hypothetical protein
MLEIGTKVVLSGVIVAVDDEDCDLPYKVKLENEETVWCGSEVCKPLKTAVAAKTSLNKRSVAPKTPHKSAKRRLRTA